MGLVYDGGGYFRVALTNFSFNFFLGNNNNMAKMTQIKLIKGRYYYDRLYYGGKSYLVSNTIARYLLSQRTSNHLPYFEMELSADEGSVKSTPKATVTKRGKRSKSPTPEAVKPTTDDMPPANIDNLSPEEQNRIKDDWNEKGEAEGDVDSDTNDPEEEETESEVELGEGEEGDEGDEGEGIESL